MLSSSDEDGVGEEKKGDSEGSATGETSAPCSPQSVKSKKDKLREKRRRRKERRRAETEDCYVFEEDDIPDFPPHYGWSGYSGTQY